MAVMTSDNWVSKLLTLFISIEKQSKYLDLLARIVKIRKIIPVNSPELKW
jgi:hypothetical protein